MIASSRRRPASWQWHPLITGHGADPVPISVEHLPNSLVHSSLDWSGFDDAGIQTDKTPLGRWISVIGEKANHVIGQGRMLFCQSLTDAESPTVTTDPLWRTLFPEHNPHGTERVWVALMLPLPVPAGAVTPPSFGRPGVALQKAASFQDARVSPTDLRMIAMVEPVIVGGRRRELDISVFDGFRLVGLTIYERTRSDGALNGDLDVFNPASVRGGAPIRDRPLRKIRRALEQAWHNLRNVTTGSVAGNATTARITGTTPTNIFDRTSTARTASTPGVLIDETRGAMSHRNSVEASVAVCASITGGATGDVQFISALGTVVIQSIGTTRQWYRASAKLSLDTDVGARGTDAATEKVDILANAGTAGQSIDVVAWSICTDPAVV